MDISQTHEITISRLFFTVPARTSASRSHGTENIEGVGGGGWRLSSEWLFILVESHLCVELEDGLSPVRVVWIWSATLLARACATARMRKAVLSP